MAAKKKKSTSRPSDAKNVIEGMEKTVKELQLHIKQLKKHKGLALFGPMPRRKGRQ
jgi:uncharacterized protein YciI